MHIFLSFLSISQETCCHYWSSVLLSNFGKDYVDVLTYNCLLFSIYCLVLSHCLLFGIAIIKVMLKNISFNKLIEPSLYCIADDDTGNSVAFGIG